MRCLDWPGVLLLFCDLNRTAELYNLEGWGMPYFKIGDTGNIEVDPTGHGHQEHAIDLHDLVQVNASLLS